MTEVRFLEERKVVLDLADVNDREVLDIGAGPLSLIAAKEYDCYVTSVDIDGEKIREWEKEAERAGVAEKIRFEEADATDLPYCKDAFDIGICFGALHHLPEDLRERALSELARVSYEKFVVAEFTQEGFAELHGGEDFVPVDLARLEGVLKTMGTLTVRPLGKLNVYIVEKGD
jgi:ubiquinone/menaquinone biosynthesis C-methylase UbiE